MRPAAGVIAVLLLLSMPFGAGAQGGSVHGRITDAGGSPVTGASLILDPGGWRARSNAQGEYTIAQVPAGTYTMRLRLIGFAAPATQVRITDGQIVQQDLTVAKAAVMLSSVVVGSRALHTAADELAVPVDVFTAEDVREQGTTETSQILSQLAPSVNFPRQSVSDATEIVRPFTMRGLSADHTLVLVNGKRRHHTALIHYYGAGQGAGSSGVDMNAIPSGAIGQLEILRDGAAAQYGSDAIAGVVNVVLKSGVFSPFLTADLGEYITSEENPAALLKNGSRPSFPRDGRTIDVNGGWGLPIGRGSLSIFAEYRDRQPTNRAGPDPTDMFTSGDADEVQNGELVSKNNSIGQPNHHWGDGSSKDFMTFASASIPLDSAGQAGLYAFGGYSFRRGAGFGYFRAPSSERNWTGIYPNGFLPKFAPDVVDLSAVAGGRGQLSGWSYDLAGSVGHDGFKYNLENTLNTSLGPCLTTPCAPGRDGQLGTADDPGIPNKRNFFAGELKLTEAILSLDASREYEAGLASPVNVAIGGAVRRENYQIGAGEPGSYINGFHPAQDGSIAPSGSQVFPGFRPEDETDSDRTNVGAYAEVEGDLVPHLLANIAARYENYSDFGNKVTGKVALRFQPTEQVTLRGAASTGFRAPSLNQSFYSSVVTNFKSDPVTGNPVPFEIGIFPVNSREAKSLGAKPLKAESSQNYSAGLAVTPAQNLTLTADLFFIRIDGRIVLTGFLDTDSVASILRAAGSRAEAAQYFTNAIDTRTRGVDVTGDYRVGALGGTVGVNAAFNYTNTAIPDENNIPLPPELVGTGEDLIGKYDEGGLLAMTKERPAWRSTVTGQYSRGAWNGLARLSSYGKYSSSLYGYCAECVQTYSAKSLVDAEVGFAPMAGLKLSVGGRNLFDVYPDRMSAANGFDIFPFPPASPFGYNGRYAYARVEWTGR
ncbi:MAG: TonB-dependent receptor [Gemmatimonadaceae bacterium]|nr:TonB-dependent receptor [Gemmatimonadaceae bacterium]